MWTFVALTTALIAPAQHASGHHSMAMYDTSAPIVLQGTVIKVFITNPHPTFVLSVRDASGNVQLWEIEAANRTWGISLKVDQLPETAILRKLKIGMTVRVSCYRVRGGLSAAFTALRDADGKDIGAIPDPIAPPLNSRN
jgi:hypothetical protein